MLGAPLTPTNELLGRSMWPNQPICHFSPAASDSTWGFTKLASVALASTNSIRTRKRPSSRTFPRFGDSPPRLYRDSMLDLTPERIMQDPGIVPGDVDAMIGGPPCQSFSVAGKRLGFADPRGQLFSRFLDLIAVIRPRFTVIENVRGVLSKNLGHCPSSWLRSRMPGTTSVANSMTQPTSAFRNTATG
jgi:C-5 cytosine-specific DNA methylase